MPSMRQVRPRSSTLTVRAGKGGNASKQGVLWGEGAQEAEEPREAGLDEQPLAQGEEERGSGKR